MNEHETVVYQFHQEAFTFLGIENILTESSDFGYFWDHFFKVGGYDKILAFAVDPKPLNVWYTNDVGENIYFQGLMVENVDEIPEDYSFKKFPASDFLVVTHEWMKTNDEALRYGIGAGWNNIKAIQIPDGYVRYEESITIIEKENCDTPQGSRYEFWVPIKKAEPKIITYQMKHEELNFICKEYSRHNADYVAIWDDFIGMGGFEIIKKYRTNSYYYMVVHHKINTEYGFYCPGTFVDEIDEIPEGFKIIKIPKCEYLVVTHEWLPEENGAGGQIGRICEYQQNVQIPDGYIRFDGAGSQIEGIEAENLNTQNGIRYEF